MFGKYFTHLKGTFTGFLQHRGSALYLTARLLASVQKVRVHNVVVVRLNGRPEVVFARRTQTQGGAAVQTGGTALTVSASPRITVHFIAMRIFLKVLKGKFLAQTW